MWDNDDKASKEGQLKCIDFIFSYPYYFTIFSAINCCKDAISEIWILDVSEWRSFISTKIGRKLHITCRHKSRGKTTKYFMLQLSLLFIYYEKEEDSN